MVVQCLFQLTPNYLDASSLQGAITNISCRWDFWC